MTDNVSFADNADNKSPDDSGGAFDDKGTKDTGVHFEVNGRKYTAEAAIKKITSADQHIATLEAERQAEREQLAALKAEVNKYKGTAEVLARKLELDGDNKQTIVDPDQIAQTVASMVRGSLDEEARIARQNENLAAVKQSLTKKYGTSVDEVVAKVVEPLGMTKAEAMEFAKTKPKAFLAYFDKVAAPVPQPTKSDINTQALKGSDNAPTKRNIFEARTDRDRMEIYQEALNRKLQGAG
jgi:ATP-dependent Lon protease